MKRLLLPLLAALALPTAVNSEGFTEIKPKIYIAIKNPPSLNMKIKAKDLLNLSEQLYILLVLQWIIHVINVTLPSMKK